MVIQKSWYFIEKFLLLRYNMFENAQSLAHLESEDEYQSQNKGDKWRLH